MQTANVMLLFLRAFTLIFHFKLQFLLEWEDAKIFLFLSAGTLATPVITLWVPLLRHNGFTPAPADWTYRGEGKSINHGTGFTEIVWQRKRSILFSMLMFMPVVSAILTRNERHFSIAVGDEFLGMQDFDFAQI